MAVVCIAQPLQQLVLLVAAQPRVADICAFLVAECTTNEHSAQHFSTYYTQKQIDKHRKGSVLDLLSTCSRRCANASALRECSACTTHAEHS